ncbi:MAG: RdgB/HAM1 family non-canonical purine NTP pyrophosphatase [Bacteroidetes bacterium]|nr:RdgB/HAM1 family non-canonical purine NTP pyrophosphatase [Bacteroidota bacterium]
MPALIFATNNKNKVDEIRSVLDNRYEIISLKEAGILIEIPEPHQTLEENASEKSKTIFTLTGKDCFSEDTGLEVEALNGEPGVRSARYAGDESDFKKNIQKLLSNLGENSNRKACFKTIISLILDGKEYMFEGICDGTIINEERGTGGFGYDPVFIPNGDTRTFAEMSMDEKNKFSHRKKATAKLIEFLNNRYGKN